MDPWTIAYIVIAIVLSMALAPKPPASKPATLDDFSIPTAEEGRPVPVVFGKVRITGANVLWYGDLKTKKLKKSSLFGSTTLGYEYYMGLHFGLCHGPVDAILALDAGEKLAWSGNVTASTAGFTNLIAVRARSLFGGKKKEGGLEANVAVRMGEPTQISDGYLDNFQGPPAPAYRGITSLVWHGTIASAILGKTGGYIGNTPYIKPFAWTVRRQLKGWYQDTVWYSAKCAIGDGMNPAHICYEAITNPEWGMGLPTSVIDVGTFTAAADTLHAENFGLQMMWNRESTVEDFLQEVVNHVSAAIAFNRATGKYELLLLRGGYDPETLPEYGPAQIIDVRSYQRQAWGETCNELTLVYTDPVSLKRTGVTTHDLGNIASQGQRIPQKIEYPGITDHALATKVAEREITARSVPLAKLTIAMDRTAWAHKQGDLIRLTWPQLGISQMVVRIMAGRNGTLTDGEIELEGIEDVFSMPSSTYTDTPPVGSDPTAPTYDEEPDVEGASVISSTTAAPPGSPADGDSYLIPTGATGEWATHIGEVATWDADLETPAWVYSIPQAGTVVTVTTTGTQVQTVTGASAVPYTPIQTTGKVIFGTAITPTDLAADENDYAPAGLSGCSGMRLTATGAARTITGLTGGETGRLLLVHNVGALDIVLADESASSTAANRFALNAAVTLKADQSTLLQYDAISARWRVIGGTGSGAGGVPNGGTTGQALVKLSAADQDTGWSTISGGGSGGGGGNPAVLSALAADKVVSSNAVYQDTDISIALEAGSTYNIRGTLNTLGLASNIAYFRLNFTGTVTTCQGMWMIHTSGGGTAQYTEHFETIAGTELGVSTTSDHGLIYDLIFTPATAGTLTVQIKQGTSSATAIKLYAGSYLIAERMATTWAGSDSGCIVTRAATQTLTTAGVEYAISWDTEVLDAENYWAISPNPTRIVIPRSGWYTIAGNVYTSTAGTDVWTLRFAKNGAALANTEMKMRGGVNTSIVSYPVITEPNYYSAGDYLELMVNMRSGSSIPVYARASIVRLSGPTGPKGDRGETGGVGVMATYKYKAADEARTSTTALADDADLKVTLEANKKYRFKFYMISQVEAAPDYKFEIGFTGTATYTRYGLTTTAAGYLAPGGTKGTGQESHGFNAFNVYTQFLVPGQQFIFHEWEGVVEVGGTGGDLAWRFAQNASSATPIYNLRGSYLEVEELTPSVATDKCVYKAAATSRASTATLTDDPDLQLPMEANAVYEFEIFGAGIAQNAPGISWNLNFTGTVTSTRWKGQQQHNNSASFGVLSTINYDSAQNAIPSGTNLGWANGFGPFAFTFTIRGMISVGASGGTFSLRWAQRVSNATAAQLDAGSFMRVRRVA